jgi:hypothetical protein
LAHGHRSDAGDDLALGQMPMTHDPPAARIGLEMGIPPQEVSGFCSTACVSRARVLLRKISVSESVMVPG